MRTLKMISVLALFGIALVLTGCTSSTPTEPVAAPVNANCPIMGGKVTEDGGRVDWNGQTVGFCCPECIPEWNELTDEEKATKLAGADNSNADDDHSDPGAGKHSDH